MTEHYDAIVVGAGHNGLVCACYLARAGRKVLVLEARDSIGGMAGGETIGGDYYLPGLAHWAYPLPESIRDELELADHGLVSGEPIETILLDEGGEHLTLGAERAAGPALSDSDRQRYAEFKAEFRRYARVLAPVFAGKPPRLRSLDRRDKLTLARAGWRLRFGLGRDAMQEFLRVAGMNIYDVLNEAFDDDRLKAAIATDAVMGHTMGPRTPGTVFTYLTRISGELRGQMMQLTIGRTRPGDALVHCAEVSGAELRTGCPVRRIIVKNGRATGIEANDGTVITAPLIVSSADARTTLLDLVGARELDAMFAQRVSRIRGEGTVAKLHIALEGLPMFPGLTEAMLKNRLIVAPSMDYIENAFNPSKYRLYAEEPVLEITIPSLLDDSLAPEGHQVVSVNACYAPCNVEGGWTEHRSAFAYRIIALIDRYAPGFKSRIVDHKLVTPEDIEMRFRCRGGHWHHGELTLHQSLMMRPVHGAAQYDTPVDGLFLCGASTHPGGGVTGLPGHNAAKRILGMRA